VSSGSRPCDVASAPVVYTKVSPLTRMNSCERPAGDERGRDDRQRGTDHGHWQYTHRAEQAGGDRRTHGAQAWTFLRRGRVAMTFGFSEEESPLMMVGKFSAQGPQRLEGMHAWCGLVQLPGQRYIAHRRGRAGGAQSLGGRETGETLTGLR